MTDDKGQVINLTPEEVADIRNSLEHLRAMVTPDQIDDLVADLHKKFTKEEQPLSESIISTVSSAIADSVDISISQEGDDPLVADLTPDQVDALKVEANRLFAETIPNLVRTAANTPSDQGLTFWQQMAQDIIAHAILWARDDSIEQYGGIEAVQALEGEAWDSFYSRVWDMYHASPTYIATAMVRGTDAWTPRLGEITYTGLRELLGDGENSNTETLAKLVRKARKSLGYPDVEGIGKGNTRNHIHTAPAFAVDGLGRVGNDLISRATQLMLVSTWEGTRTMAPAFNHETSTGTVTYEVETDSLQEAWDLVARLGDGHVDVFDYIIAKMLAGKTDETRDTYGDFLLTPQELCDMRGHQKHHKGGHHLKNLQEVIGQVEDLKHLKLQAIIQETRDQAKGRKPHTLIHTVNLISINETLEQMQTDGGKTIIGWALRPGNWARELELFSKQYAVTMRGILMLHSKNDAYAKRIARYLMGQFRNNANKKQGPLVRKVSTILKGAGIDLPTRNKPRFRDQVARGLNTIADQDKMRGPVCIMSWKYQKPIDFNNPKWYDAWLDSNVEIIANPVLMEERYKGISQKGERYRALQGGKSA